METTVKTGHVVPITDATFQQQVGALVGARPRDVYERKITALMNGQGGEP